MRAFVPAEMGGSRSLNFLFPLKGGVPSRTLLSFGLRLQEHFQCSAF